MEKILKKQNGHGGAREGAGRKIKDSEPRTKTITMRITESDYAKIKSIEDFSDVFLNWLRNY